jgi:arylsulfatase A-like enzyme
VALLDAQGRETRLFEHDLASLAGAGTVAIEQALDVATPSLAVLSLSVSGEGAAAEGATVAWRALRIEGAEPAPEPHAPGIPRDRYNVFVVLFDSLRADHVEPSQSVEVSTPHFARLAASGVRFENARTNSSWTRPAVASLLASVPPSEHHVATWEDRLPDSIPSLAERLRDAGYQNAFVTANVMTDPAFGFGRGFELARTLFTPLVEDLLRRHPLPQDRAQVVWDQFLSVTVTQPLALEAERKPFFVFLHELDPHSPYEPPEPYADLYAFGYRGRLEASHANLLLAGQHPLALDPVDLRQLHALYRGEVSAMDAYLGWLLDQLEARGLRERTLVVLLSDHGEEFQEHRGMGHGHTAYEELLRVPLILSLPGVLPQGLRSGADADLMDLAPTILDLLGLEIPPEMRGASLLPRLSESGSPVRRPSFAQSSGARHDALRLGRWKLIRERASDSGRGQAQYSLFDLESDPGETLDRWPAELAVGTALRQLLLAGIFVGDGAQPAAPPPQALDPALLEQLRALGYLK